MPPAILIKGECRAVESTFIWPLRFWFVGVSAAVLVAQVGQIGPANADIGFQPPDPSLMSLVIAVSGLAAFAWLNRRGTQRPSDYFRFLHAVGVVFPLIILHDAADPTMPAMWLFAGLLILALPLLMMASVGAWVSPMKSPGLGDGSIIRFVVASLLMIVALAAVLQAPSSAGLSLDDSYTRRLEGRSVYPAGSLLAYGLVMSMNGFAPYLAFVGSVGKRGLLLFVAMVSSAFFYWLVGVKAPALYVVVAALLGWAVRNGRADKIPVYLLQGIAILGVSVLVEWALFDGYSLVADYLLRRVYSAPAFIQTRYLHFLMDDKPLVWSWLLGGASPDFSVTYFIGEYYFGNVNSNVNTDAFLYALSASGLLGYLTAVLAVILILAL